MREYRYRLLNVFTDPGARLSGNPLCVFEDARGLDDSTMQALALQFNLSETTFLFPSATASARVRIYTPAFEMPFAGHPTLGTAHIVRSLANGGDEVRLETKAGVVPVRAAGDTWTLEARAPTWRPAEATPAQLAQMLGIERTAVAQPALWVDTGSEQLVVPLTDAAAVARCRPNAGLLAVHGRAGPERYLAYVWAPAGDDDIAARFFFPKLGAVTEDPATGSACANLGGWFVATRARLPLARRVRQGDEVRRPSRLGLEVDADGRIFVSGEVIELGRGTIRF